MKPQDLPKTLKDARRSFLPAWVGEALMSPKMTDEIIATGKRPDKDGFYPVIAITALGLYLSQHFVSQGKADDRDIPFDKDLEGLMIDIAAVLKKRNIPALVVQIPMINPSEKQLHPGIPGDTTAFANIINATLVDGNRAFTDLPPESQRKCFLRSDPHFSPSGSDQFGDFMAVEISKWLQMRRSQQN